MPTTSGRHHRADLYCPQGITLSIDGEETWPTTCVNLSCRQAKCDALQHPENHALWPGYHAYYLFQFNNLNNFTCNGERAPFAAPQTPIEANLYDLLTALSFLTRLRHRKRASDGYYQLG
jgi:hypothetical protein